MDFDPKCFFEQPLRMKEEVKDYLKDMSYNVLNKLIVYSQIMFPSERITPKHLQMIVLAMSVDPVTCYNRQGLCIQNTKIKTISRVLCKSISTAIQNTETDKYGGLDKKIYKSCVKILKEQNCSFSSQSIVAFTAIISEIIGIVLQSTIDNTQNVKTLTLELIKKEGTLHRNSTGTIYPYGSLIRFINIVDTFSPHAISKPVKKTKSILKTPKVSFQSIDNNQSKISNRPTTPDNCFWESD